jgi:hypothetical protein
MRRAVHQFAEQRPRTHPARAHLFISLLLFCAIGICRYWHFAFERAAIPRRRQFRNTAILAPISAESVAPDASGVF